MNKTNSTSINFLTILKTAGAFIAFLIGSGFATGQEIMQFFVAYGYRGIIGSIVTLFFLIYLCNTLLRTGQRYQLRKNEDIFVHYCGKYVGIFLTWYTMIFIIAVHAIMLSGAGATLQAYYGFPAYIGTGLMAFLSMLTIMMGLKKMVTSIAMIGPVVIAFIVMVALLTIINGSEAIGPGLEKIANSDMLKASSHWLFSSLLYVGLIAPGIASFLPAVGAEMKNSSDIKYASILGPVLYVGAIILLSLALMIQIEEVNGTLIPVMVLAKSILPIFESIFTLVILLGIYSTATPLLWTVVARFAEEKTPKYFILSIVLTMISFLGGMVLPFDRLVNIIYPTVGYAGLLFVSFAIRKDVKEFLASRNSK